MSSAQDGRSSTQRGSPSARELANVANTRSLIDERGRRDAVADETACAARLNKTLIYLSFDSKGEIFGAEFPHATDPVAALRPVCERYIQFCLDCPAFPDRGKALTQRSAAELPEQVSGAVLFRLARAGIGARQSAPCVAKTFRLHRERERQARGQQSLALARVTAGASA